MGNVAHATNVKCQRGAAMSDDEAEADLITHWPIQSVVTRCGLLPSAPPAAQYSVTRRELASSASFSALGGASYEAAGIHRVDPCRSDRLARRWQRSAGRSASADRLTSAATRSRRRL